MRGTTNRNQRGNTRDRAARKRWLLEVYAADKRLTRFRVKWTASEGINRWDPIPTCRCYRCGELLTYDTITVDRIVPGCKGGRYTRNNIRPACGACNSETGGRLSWSSR